jgi:LytS/YehU family sensor histidine kinase
MIVAKDFLDKAKKNKSQNESELLKDKSKAAITGLAIGGIAGLYIGYTRKYNILISVFLGGLVGSLLTRALLKPKKKDDE